MKSSINLRFLLASLAGVGVLSLGTALVHAFQMQRQSAFMLDRARQCEKEMRYEMALRSYQLYLHMSPRDLEARGEFGLLLADHGLANMAATQFEAVLRSAPDRAELRRRLIDIDIDRKRYSDAREHLRFLLAVESDGKLWQQLGICQDAGGDYSGAKESYQKAIAISPGQCESYARLAEVLRTQLDNTEEADARMDELVAKNADSSRAHLLRARYLYVGAMSPKQVSSERKIAALREAEKAAELDPKDVDALLLAANLTGLATDYDKARHYAEQATSAAPTLAEGYLTLFRVEIRTDHRDRGVEVLRRGVEKATEPRGVLWALGRILIEKGDLDEAEKAVAQLRGLPATEGFDPVSIDYLQAQIEAARGHWYAASLALSDVARQLEQPKENRGSGFVQIGSMPELKEVAYRLAQCDERLGDTEAQLAAYRKAATIDPLWVPARMGVAATLSSLGQVSEALEEYRQIGRLEGMAATGEFEVARLLAIKNLRLPAAQRDWKEVEAILERLRKANPDATDVTLLRAEILVGQGRTEETEKLLVAARDASPEKTDLWSALVSLAVRRQQWDQAMAVLGQGEMKFGDRVFLRLARGQYLLSRYGKKETSELAKLGDDTVKFSPEDRLRLCRGLTMYLWEAGDLERAKQLAGQACKADRTNLAMRLLLFELTYLSKDASGMEKVLAEIRSFQKEGALWHYGEAVRLAVLAEQEKEPQKQASEFRQAIDHLAAAREQRPGWGRVPLLAGRLYDRLGLVDSAIDDYCKAIDSGEVGPATVRRAFELLYSRQRYAEADEMLRHVEQRQAVFFTELGRLASEVSMRLENIDRAVEISRQVADQSKDWADHLWLGELQGFLGRRALADQSPEQAQVCFLAGEKSLRRAVELGPEAPETWVGLIRFLASTGQKAAAEALLGDSIKKIPADKVALALGPCYEALGKLDEATKQYHSILAKGSKDPIVLRNVAEFCIRVNKPEEAEDYLQRILGGQVVAKLQDVAWARRAMAGILRQRGGYANLLKAVALIDENLATLSGPDDLREKAVLLAAFPQRAKRLEAIAALEQVVRSQPSEMAEVRYALAMLYLREKDWLQTNKQMRALLASHGNEVRYLAVYVSMLMDRNEMQEAELWLNRLEELAPQNSMTITLRSEALVRRQQTELAIELLHKFLERPVHVERPADKETERDARILQVFSILKTLADAAGKRSDSAGKVTLLTEMEILVRDYVTRHPDDAFLVAFTVLQEGHIDKALVIAEKSWPTADLNRLTVESLQLVDYPALSPEQARKLERIVLSIADQKGRPIPLLLVVGHLRMRESPQDAIPIYREILAKDPVNIVALNNLALLLALRKQDVEESLKLVDRAIDIAGPVSAMLDTRAVVRMASGQREEALADLAEVIRDDPQPSNYFHQALIYAQLGRQREAIEAFRAAHKMGLKPDDLLVLERPGYEELSRDLSP